MMSDLLDTGDASAGLAVLCSGGLDSAILLAEACRRHSAVTPLYVRFGLAWEEVERAHLERFLAALPAPAPLPLVVLDMPVRDLYGKHWSITGDGVPGADTPDEAVLLPGRNVLLLAKALLWCHLQGVNGVALGTLESNPFPDATAEFFQRCAELVNQAVGGAVRIWCPYRCRHKVEVLRAGEGLPLEHTFSCIRPRQGRHCGACNKCAERQKGFRQAGLVDPTSYFARMRDEG
jgi:7-cyano-7-deazaguanine synthase